MKTSRNLKMKKFPKSSLDCLFPYSVSVKVTFSEFVCNQIEDADESLTKMFINHTWSPISMSSKSLSSFLSLFNSSCDIRMFLGYVWAALNCDVIIDRQGQLPILIKDHALFAVNFKLTRQWF